MVDEIQETIFKNVITSLKKQFGNDDDKWYLLVQQEKDMLAII